MRKLNVFLLLVLATIFTLTSCQKEAIESSPTTERSTEKLNFDEPLQTLEDFKALEGTAQSRNGEDADLTDNLQDGGDISSQDGESTGIESTDVNDGQFISVPSIPNLRCGYRYYDSNRGRANNFRRWYVYGRTYEFSGGERVYSFNTSNAATILLRPTSNSSDLDLFVINANTGRVVNQSTNAPGRRERVDLRPGNYILVVDSQYRSREGSYHLSFYCSTPPTSCNNISSYQYSWNDYDFQDNSGQSISYWKITRKFDGATKYIYTSNRRITVLFSYATEYEVKVAYRNGRYCTKTVHVR